MNKKMLKRGVIALGVLLSIQFQGMAQVKANTISYKDFTINTVQKKILINWQTASQDQANYFEVQRSFDGKNFRTIELVLGPDPQKSDCNCYMGFDQRPVKAKKYYYRLKHIAKDGAVELSETRMIAFNN